MQRVATGLALPSKTALAPDGRCLVNEPTSGNVRVIAADNALWVSTFTSIYRVTRL